MGRILSVRTLVMVVCVTASLVRMSWAQVQNASLTGLITDQSGAVIVGAHASLKNVATNVTFTQVTDSSGYYLFPALPIGDYTITIEMEGFKKAV